MRNLSAWCLLVLYCLALGQSFADEESKPVEIPADIWPDDEQPLLKIHPNFNHPSQIKYRLTLADDWPSHTPLAYAFAQGDRAMARVLLKRGADPNQIVTRPKVTPVSPIQAAIARNDPESIRFLLKVGAKPTVDYLSDVAVVQTAKTQTEMTRLILESGVKPNKSTVVNDFASRASPEAFALLFKHGAQVNNKVGSFQLAPTLCIAIASTEKVRIALKHGADPNQGTHIYNETPLHFCAQRGSAATIELLVTNGADVNVKNRTGETPIERALIQGSFRPFYKPGEVEMIRAFLRHGAKTSIAAEVATGNVKALRARKQKGEAIQGLPKLDIKSAWYGLNEARRDLIATAVSFRQPEALAWLLENGVKESVAASPNVKSDRLDSPALVVAAFQSDAKSVEILLKHGADPNVRSPRAVYVAAAYRPLHSVIAGAAGTTFLQVAKNREVKLDQPQRKIISLLLQYGADPDLKNGYGQAARDFAKVALPNERLFQDKN
ncbi:MAG: hypothetical protein CMJ78_27840 [Planctomycetaceae bacterium]|nr:hypothetical protein [Planctomycetaceae bacterium]